LKEEGAIYSEDEKSNLYGLTEAKRNMYELVDEVKDGPWFT
jgi:hypothetical protein